MAISQRTTGPALMPASAGACPTTPRRGYPYDGFAQYPGQSNFAGLDSASTGATLAARLEDDVTAIDRRLHRLERTATGPIQFPHSLIDAHWERWDIEIGLGVEPTYTPHPGTRQYAARRGAGMPYSELVATRGPVRRIGPALYVDLAAAHLATVGPDVLAAAIGAIQRCAGRLLAAGVDAATAMSAGRPGSWEAGAMRHVIDGGSAYIEPADVIDRVGAILHDWVTGDHYAEVAESYAGVVSTAATAIGLDNIDLETIAEHCDPEDPHSGAAGWLLSLTSGYETEAPS